MKQTPRASRRLTIIMFIILAAQIYALALLFGVRVKPVLGGYGNVFVMACAIAGVVYLWAMVIIALRKLWRLEPPIE